MNLNNNPVTKAVVVVLALAATGASVFWIWKQQQPPRPEDKYSQYVAMGRVLAEETMRAIEHRPKKRVLIITGKTDDPIMGLQLDSLVATLKKNPEIEIKDTETVESEKKRGVGPGNGLSARRFVRIVEKNLKADAIVSLVGMPEPDDKDLKDLDVKVPRVIAFVSDRDRVEPLFAQKMLKIAVVHRFQFPSPVKEPKSPQEAFDKYFQVVRAPKSTNDAPEKAAEPGKTKPAATEAATNAPASSSGK
jgi:hypothetical protein